MKRFIALAAVIAMVVLFSGCSVLLAFVDGVRSSSADVSTQATDVSSTIEPDASADTATVAPVEAAPTANPNEYTSASLGITFTVPDSWVGKYRVEEGDGYLTVYFKPAETIEDDLGALFFITKKTSDDDEDNYDNPVDFQANGQTYIFGMPTDLTYSEDNPEYDTFVNMKAALPAICQSLTAAE